MQLGGDDGSAAAKREGEGVHVRRQLGHLKARQPHAQQPAPCPPTCDARRPTSTCEAHNPMRGWGAANAPRARQRAASAPSRAPRAAPAACAAAWAAPALTRRVAALADAVARAAIRGRGRRRGARQPRAIANDTRERGRTAAQAARGRRAPAGRAVAHARGRVPHRRGSKPATRTQTEGPPSAAVAGRGAAGT